MQASGLPSTKIQLPNFNLERINIMTKITNYNETRQRFENGEITLEQWQEFCFEVLCEIMEDNKDVLIRLKNRE
mgnify:CR=1 FL=1